MVRSVLHYPPESIVLVKGKIRKSPHKIQNATIHDAEISIREIHLISKLEENVPFTVYDAENIGKLSKNEIAEDSDSSMEPGEIGVVKTEPHQKSGYRKLPQAFRLNNRIMDLRAPVSQSIFRIESGVTNIFRSYMDSQGFIEIHTPKLQGSATESGASVFEVNYFGRPAYLAQSPQLAKQMSIAADFERVYEVGPVFRAEDSNTPRHLTEFTGLDIGERLLLYSREPCIY
jgi:aspartyl/asparaginyl-tRNA synthetase